VHVQQTKLPRLSPVIRVDGRYRPLKNEASDSSATAAVAVGAAHCRDQAAGVDFQMLRCCHNGKKGHGASVV
jgi:hypothetical protein